MIRSAADGVQQTLYKYCERGMPSLTVRHSSLYVTPGRPDSDQYASRALSRTTCLRPIGSAIACTLCSAGSIFSLYSHVRATSATASVYRSLLIMSASSNGYSIHQHSTL